MEERDNGGFKLTMVGFSALHCVTAQHFQKNPYFKNNVLTFEADVEDGAPTASPIEWFPGKVAMHDAPSYMLELHAPECEGQEARAGPGRLLRYVCQHAGGKRRWRTSLSRRTLRRLLK